MIRIAWAGCWHRSSDRSRSSSPGRPIREIAEGKRLLQGWAEFVQRPAVRSRAVFLEDYDMSLAQELVQGVDVWINTPRRPWEACGTSGMKVLVNGGLNLSELDGWWAEAYRADAGWALGGDDGPASGSDAAAAERLYGLLEREIIPEFYARDAQGIPRAWVERIRASMANLAPSFSSNRMMREYVERHYLPAASAFRRRSADGARLARELGAWTETLERHWSEVRFGEVNVSPERDGWSFEAHVYLGAIPADMVRVELYADATEAQEPVRQPLKRCEELRGSTNAYVYRAAVPASSRPWWHFTPRIVPHHQDAFVPIEAPFIVWADAQAVKLSVAAV